MKKLVTEQKRTEATFDDLKGSELVIYQSKSKGIDDNFCFLARLNIRGEQNKWGFISLDDAGAPPRYVGNSFHDAVKKVSDTGRQVFIFDNSSEMISFVNEIKQLD